MAEIGAGMHEETERELERIRREVSMAKEELRNRFDYYFRLLREKHLKMETRLEEVVHVAEKLVLDRQTQLNQLKNTKADVLRNSIHNELNETLVNFTQELDEKIQGLEAIMDQVPSVWLEWRDDWLVDGMTELCRVSEGVSYVNRHNPVWSGANKGLGQNEIYSPSRLSTDRHNGDVYVCDLLAHKIQVFSREGIHQRAISPRGLHFLTDITVTHHHLFVRGLEPYCIYKLDKLSNSIMCSVEIQDDVNGLLTDTDTLYAGMCKSNQISHFSLEDLTTIRVTLLNSPHVTQDTRLQDLRVVPSLFIVLFESTYGHFSYMFYQCDYPIQTFSRDGNLLQVIVSQDQLIGARHLCVDRHLNIVVSDSKDHNLKILSIEGHLLTIIGQKGEGPGMFYYPAGIDLDKEGRIVVVDHKKSHKLQFF